MLFRNLSNISNREKLCFILLISLAPVFFSCFSKKNTIKGLHIENSGKNIVFQNTNLAKIKSDIYNDGRLISLLDNRNAMIYIYDYRQNIFIDSIDIKYRNTRQFLFDYHILDKDRILLSVNPTYFADQHDSVVCIIDRNKTVLTTFSFENTPAPVYNQDSPRQYRNTNWWFSIHSGFPVRLNEKDSTVLSVLAPFHVQTCDSIQNNSKVFAYKISSAKNIPAQPLAYRIPECSKYYNPKSKLSVIPYGDYGKNNDPVIGYPHSPVLMSNNTVFKPDLQLYKLIDEHTYLDYRRIVYDKYRDCFWWVIEVEVDNEKSEQQLKNYSDYYLVCLNNKLRVTSEGFLPAFSNPHILPLKEGLLIKNDKQSDSLGVNYHSLFLPKTQRVKPETIKTELSERSRKKLENLGQFYKLLKNENSENRFLVFSLDRMPPNYTQLLFKYLEENKEKFTLNTIFIFTNEESKIPESLKNKVNVYRNNVLREYINDLSAPAIIERLDNGEITLTQYPTNKSKLLIENILNW